MPFKRLLLASAITSVSGPSLPTYIVNARTSFPGTERFGVSPRDSPTVPKADTVSYIIYSREAPVSVIEQYHHYRNNQAHRYEYNSKRPDHKFNAYPLS